MLGIFKKFWKTEASNVVTVPPPSPPPARPAATPPPRSTPVAPRVHQPVTAVRAASQTHYPSVPGSVTITLGAIEPSLPEPLRHKIVGALHELVPVPINRVLPQMHRGAVSLTVKELRECSPELLASFQGHDEIPVTLPLADLVRQIDPKLLPRRNSQKRIEVPNEVAPIFTQTSDGLTVIAPPPAAPAAPRPSPATIRPATTATTTAPAPATVPAPLAPSASASVTAEPAPVAAKPERIALSAEALAALAAAAPKKAAPAKGPAIAVPTPPAAPAPSSASVTPLPSAASRLPKPVAPAAPSTPLPAAAPAAPVPVASVKPSSAAAPAGKSSATLPMPFEKLVPALPPEVCKELGDVHVKESSVALPMPEVESMLKSGKVLFTWGDLASWLTPPMPRPPSNSASSLLVEIPLKVIAPVFMAHHRASGVQKRAATGEGIPDLFQSQNGAAEPAAAVSAAPVVAAPTPTAPVEVEPAPAPAKKSTKAAKTSAAPARPAEPALPPLEALLGTSAGKFAPREVIQNVVKLPGVAGALLAMTDGLPVASVMPTAVKADAMAAFLPQMFGRMTQYTKELGLGAVQTMTINVEGGCWQVFKQPNIYFAVCGKPGEQMPFNLLAQVAAELSKQPM